MRQHFDIPSPCHPMLWCAVVLFAAVGVVRPAAAQLRIVTYNTNAGPRPESDLVLQEIGLQAVQGIAKPIDILLLQEQSSFGSTTQAFVNELNALYGSGAYALVSLDVATSGSGRPGMIYRTSTVQLVDHDPVGVVSGSGQARQGARYVVRPVGYDSAANFVLYNNHYKAGDSSTDLSRRNVEAAAVRADANALGEGTPIVFAGDLNVKTNLEPMWNTLRAPGAGQAFDPINREGIWSNSSAFRDVHTQSPTTSERFPGQITGGMDDRFDFQLVSNELLDGEGIDYIPGTYRAFGNNGTHPLNGNLDDLSNSALPSSVLAAIATSSDHLPVVADYQIPAKMAVTVGAVPPRVITGATANVSVQVSNVAPAVHAMGADELDFLVQGAAGVLGTVAGVDHALGGSQNVVLPLNTATLGVQFGSVSVTSASPAVANGSFLQLVPFEVIDHAQPSFSSATAQAVLNVDLGVLPYGGSSATASADIHNRSSASPFASAALDIDAVSASGDLDVFSNTLAPVTGITAGGSRSFEMALAPNRFGFHEAHWELQVSDEDLLGAVALQPLDVFASAIVAMPGDSNLDGVVSLLDLDTLGQHFGGPGDWQAGDFTGDGLVTLLDLDVLGQYFGQSVPGWGSLLAGRAAVAVPEPSSAALLLGGAACGLVWRRSRKRTGGDS